MKIPIILAQEPVAVPTAPRYGGVQETGLAAIGQGLADIGAAAGRIARVEAKAAEKAGEKRRQQELEAFDADTWTALDVGAKTLRIQQAETDDPEEFQRITAKGFMDLHQAAQQQAGSDPERRALAEKRYQQVLRSEADTFATGLIGRRLSKSRASLGRLEERTRERMLETTDPKELHRLNGDFRVAVEDPPYLQADEKQRIARAFTDRVQTDWLALQAANDPLGFSPLALRGKVDSLALERAGNIADKELKARDERNRRLNEDLGRDIERAFWQQAQAGTLDRDRLDSAADWLRWPKDKVDNLWRTQLGLKTSSPEADALLAAAMDPVNKVDPTMQDVDQAWENLTGLAADVSRKSVEYQRQVTRLRAHRDALMGRGKAEDNRHRAETMRRLGILLDKHVRKSRHPRYAQQMAKWREDVMLRPAAELPGLLIQIEKDLMDAAKGSADVQKDIEGLKGLRK